MIPHPLVNQLLCSFYIYLAVCVAALLTTTPRNVGCVAGGRTSPALAVYSFVKASLCSSAALTRLAQHSMGFACWQLNLKRTIVPYYPATHYLPLLSCTPASNRLHVDCPTDLTTQWSITQSIIRVVTEKRRPAEEESTNEIRWIRASCAR